jgi:CheY-like chemotaxis protein
MPGTILVVEDNEMNMRLMVELLSHFGYEVLEAGNGLQAMMLVHQHHVDLILMDMQMPIMNGFECVKMLRTNEKTAQIKIVAVTSFAMEEDQKRIFETGVDELILKPFNTREFSKRIEQILEQNTK